MLTAMQDDGPGVQALVGDHGHADLLFLIMHYLSAGVCPEAARALEREALSKGLLPTRLDFTGHYSSLLCSRGSRPAYRC